MVYCKAQHFYLHFVWHTFFAIIQEQSTALHVYLGKMDPVKLSESGEQDLDTHLNQNL